MGLNKAGAAALAAKSIFEDDRWAHDTASKHLEALAEK
jgi:hypothetical protein